MAETNKSEAQRASLWTKNMNCLTRLMIAGSIYKENGHYFIKLSNRLIELQETLILSDLYINVYEKPCGYRDDVNLLYKLKWEGEIFEMVTNPKKYLPAALKVQEIMKNELHEAAKRPNVGKDDFAIDPKRNTFLAYNLINKDLKTFAGDNN